ncbi:MAG TPA: hypothetical protein VM867_08505 [Xanthobacteraceae bacterium]|nr:hypothetical protein [Xanthobacteraceae bacterium]
MKTLIALTVVNVALSLTTLGVAVTMQETTRVELEVVRAGVHAMIFDGASAWKTWNPNKIRFGN